MADPHIKMDMSPLYQHDIAEAFDVPLYLIEDVKSRKEMEDALVLWRAVVLRSGQVTKQSQPTHQETKMGQHRNFTRGRYTAVGTFTEAYGDTWVKVAYISDPNGNVQRGVTFYKPRNLQTWIAGHECRMDTVATFTLDRTGLHTSWISKVEYGAQEIRNDDNQEFTTQVDKIMQELPAPTQAEAIGAIYLLPAIADVAKLQAAADAEAERKAQAGGNATLAKLLQYCSARDFDGHHLNIMLVGPAGSGKSTIARLASEKLGVPFYSDSFNRDTPPWQLVGRQQPTADGWKYMTSQFVQAYENGGIYLADEMDAADANTLLVLNMALANGSMTVPDRFDAPVAKRHADFIMVAACNTYGSGSRIYVGREELDEATLSRFVPLSVDYDADYETGVLARSEHGQALGTFRTAIREVIAAGKLRRVYSTRHLIQWTALLDAGIGFDEISREYFAAWSVADRQAAEQNATIKKALAGKVAGPTSPSSVTVTAPQTPSQANGPQPGSVCPQCGLGYVMLRHSSFGAFRSCSRNVIAGGCTWKRDGSGQ